MHGSPLIHISFKVRIHTSVLVLTGNKELTTVEPATLKQAYGGLITLVLEAVKTDCDSTHIRYWTMICDLSNSSGLSIYCIKSI